MMKALSYVLAVLTFVAAIAGFYLSWQGLMWAVGSFPLVQLLVDAFCIVVIVGVFGTIFFFRSTQNGNRKVADELRVGYSWAEVTPQAPPTLTVVQSGTNAVLSWPSFYGSDYVLQGNSNVTSGTWSSVTNAVTVSSGNNNVTVPARGSARYFRLLK